MPQFSFVWQNELAILEFIHLFVETMDRHFGNVVFFSNPNNYFSCDCKYAHIYHMGQADGNYPFGQCELDIMFHLEKVHFMLEEMVMNGCIVETSKQNILAPINLMEKT